MAEQDIVRKGDDRWERLFKKWKTSKSDAGWLVIGSEQYRVIANDDDSVIFVPVTGNIDGMYGSMSGGLS